MCKLLLLKTWQLDGALCFSKGLKLRECKDRTDGGKGWARLTDGGSFSGHWAPDQQVCVLAGRGMCWCAPLRSTNHQPFPFLWPLMCYANDISLVLRSQKGTKLLKTVHFWRTFKGFHFVNPFSIKNVCSLDHEALYMCLKQNCAQPFRDPPLCFEWKELIKGQKTQYGIMQVCS